MDRYDVLIVGGGPAGSSCARRLVQQGLSVAVLDKARFPRDKVCAGWVTPAVMETLEVDLADYGRTRTLQPITGFLSGAIGGVPVRTDYGRTVSYGIRRCEFDQYLLQRAGAELRLGERFESMERGDGAWIVNGRTAASLVVGAGGHFCPVARELGARLGSSESVVAAKEIEFPMDAAQRRSCRVEPQVPELYFCKDLMGYGWCFRKGDYLNIGLGREDNHKLSERLQAFCAYLAGRGRIPADIPARFHGHAYLLYGHAPREVVGDAVLLVGDAAGLAYPQSGEGIRPAVESGLLAADTIVAAAGDFRRERLASYREELVRRFGAGGAGAADRLPVGLRTFLAGRLLTNRWFTRHVVLDRWFLHRSQPALALRP
ncbi:MAG TPA: geranylgeranyl reductase family protein [Gammaproteobacteria bacterium]|nr:geranylgeranyl reductase family protein [Gammaproteobacteria bacterium]